MVSSVLTAVVYVLVNLTEVVQLILKAELPDFVGKQVFIERG